MASRSRVLPGFGLSMGFALFYLGLIVLLPISVLLVRGFGIPWSELWRLATGERAVASYRLTFGASFCAALINAFFGSVVAWVLARYQFSGKRLLDALIDIPFALPT